MAGAAGLTDMVCARKRQACRVHTSNLMNRGDLFAKPRSKFPGGGRSTFSSTWSWGNEAQPCPALASLCCSRWVWKLLWVLSWLRFCVQQGGSPWSHAYCEGPLRLQSIRSKTELSHQPSPLLPWGRERQLAAPARPEQDSMER